MHSAGGFTAHLVVQQHLDVVLDELFQAVVVAVLVSLDQHCHRQVLRQNSNKKFAPLFI